MYIADNSEAVRWGLEICGFQDVHLDFHARPLDLDSESDGAKADLFLSPQPMLCHLHCNARFSL